MTVSVGLGKISNDPEASLLVRKALGRLTKPATFMNDHGLTIDDEGRISLRFKTGGSLAEDADGLYIMTPIGPGVAAGTGIWNVLMTGTAANHFAGTVAIGTTTLTAKLSILSTTEQLRLLYDASNYFSVTVSSTGVVTLQTAGTSAEFDIVPPSGQGVKINSGSAIKRFLSATAAITLTFAMSPQDYNMTVTGALVGDAVILASNKVPNAKARQWSAWVSATNTVTIRIMMHPTDFAGGADANTFRATVIGF